MLKLIGSVMVFGSCAALGLSARQNLRRRVAAADAMLLALGLIRSEIPEDGHLCRKLSVC